MCGLNICFEATCGIPSPRPAAKPFPLAFGHRKRCTNIHEILEALQPVKVASNMLVNLLKAEGKVRHPTVCLHWQSWQAQLAWKSFSHGDVAN